MSSWTYKGEPVDKSFDTGFGFIYKMTLTTTGRCYYGKTRSKYWWNYYGSGTLWNQVKKIDGRECVTREILSVHKTQKELDFAELELLKTLDYNSVYNLPNAAQHQKSKFVEYYEEYVKRLDEAIKNSTDYQDRMRKSGYDFVLMLNYEKNGMMLPYKKGTEAVFPQYQSATVPIYSTTKPAIRPKRSFRFVYAGWTLFLAVILGVFGVPPVVSLGMASAVVFLSHKISKRFLPTYATTGT